MKTKLMQSEKFQQFMKQCGTLAHLPICNINLGMDRLRNFQFEDPQMEAFKVEVIDYIQSFWIKGPFPHQVWNCWSRNTDCTNNNQEGYNSKCMRRIRKPRQQPERLDFSTIVQPLHQFENRQIGITKKAKKE